MLLLRPSTVDAADHADETRNQVEVKSQRCETRKIDLDHGTEGANQKNNATRTRTETGDDRATRENVGVHANVSFKIEIVIATVTVNVGDRVRRTFAVAANPEINGKKTKRARFI
jgi:hypothetical protein